MMGRSSALCSSCRRPYACNPPPSTACRTVDGRGGVGANGGALATRENERCRSLVTDVYQYRYTCREACCPQNSDADSQKEAAFACRPE